jgi:hypothetical protein
VSGQSGARFQVKVTAMNHIVRVLSLLLNNNIPLDAELNRKQLSECAYLKRLMLLLQTEGLEIK